MSEQSNGHCKSTEADGERSCVLTINGGSSSIRFALYEDPSWPAASGNYLSAGTHSRRRTLSIRVCSGHTWTDLPVELLDPLPIESIGNSGGLMSEVRT